MYHCCLQQAAPNTATTLKPDDSLEKKPDNASYLIFSNRFRETYSRESKEIKPMPCELQARTNALGRVCSWKLCPKHIVMWPREHAKPRNDSQDGMAAKFHWFDERGVGEMICLQSLWDLTHAYCEFYFCM